MAPGFGGRVCGRGRNRIVAAAMISLLAVIVSATTAQAQMPNALPFSKGFLDQRQLRRRLGGPRPRTAAAGRATGTIPMSGVPADGEILAAYLYWETITTDVAQVDGAEFRGLPMTVVKASSRVLTRRTRRVGARRRTRTRRTR